MSSSIVIRLLWKSFWMSLFEMYVHHVTVKNLTLNKKRNVSNVIFMSLDNYMYMWEDLMFPQATTSMVGKYIWVDTQVLIMKQ